MYFVGRSRETNSIMKILERGENVIVSGNCANIMDKLKQNSCEASRA